MTKALPAPQPSPESTERFTTDGPRFTTSEPEPDRKGAMKAVSAARLQAAAERVTQATEWQSEAIVNRCQYTRKAIYEALNCNHPTFHRDLEILRNEGDCWEAIAIKWYQAADRAKGLRLEKRVVRDEPGAEIIDPNNPRPGQPAFPPEGRVARSQPGEGLTALLGHQAHSGNPFDGVLPDSPRDREIAIFTVVCRALDTLPDPAKTRVLKAAALMQGLGYIFGEDP